MRIDAGFTGWVFVTPDGRYIVTEPLYALDVRNWKQYALFEALKIPNYTTIEAISRDGKRLLISRRDCAMDCPEVRLEYYELTLPSCRANRTGWFTGTGYAKGCSVENVEFTGIAA